MRAALCLLALPLGLAITACGSNADTTTVKTPDGDVTITTSPSGETTTMVAKGRDGTTVTIDQGGNSWPTNAPSHAPAYPGAKVTMVMKSVDKGSVGSRLAFETRDRPAAVVAFYKARAEKAGLPELATLNNADMSLYSAGGGSSPAIIVQATRKDGKTVAMLTFSNAGTER